MSFYGTPGYSYSRARNLSTKEGAIMFEANVGVEPTGTTDPGKFVLYRYGGDLKIWDGSNRTTIMQTGGGINAPTEASAPSSPAVGDIYYDSTLGKIRGYQTTGWTAFDGTSAGSLDGSYNGGNTITVDAGALTLTDTQTATGGGLLITKSGVVTGANSASIFHINSTGAHDTSGDVKFLEISVGAETISGSVYGIEIAMNANTDSGLEITKGAVVLTDGAMTLTSGNLTMSSGNLDVTGTITSSGTVTCTGAATVGTTLVVTGNTTAGGTLTVDTDSAVAFVVQEEGGTAVLTVDTTQDVADTSALLTTKVTTGTGMHIDGSTITTGDALKITVAAATMGATGSAISVVADGTEVFAVRDDGQVLMKGTAEGSTALGLTTGDLVVTDGDLIVSGGEVAFTSTSTTAGLVIVNNTITTANSLVDISSTSITTGAAMRINANTTAHDGEILELINAGDATSTGTGLSITMSAIATGAGKGIWVDLPEATSGAKGISVRMDKITTSDMLYLDAGGATMTGAGRFINCNDDDASKFSVASDGATVIAGTAAGTAVLTLSLGDLVITDTDATTITSVNGTGSTLTITNGGAAGADKAALEVVGSGTSNADSAIIRATQDSQTGASFVMNLKQDDLDVGFVNFEGVATADASSPISTHGTAGATTDFIRIAINGTKAWIAVSTNDPTA